MSLNEKLEKMRAKKQSVELPIGDEKIELSLRALTFDELTELAVYSDKKDTKGAMNFLLYTALRKALPEEGEEAVSDEYIKGLISDMDGGIASTIIRKIQAMSGLGDDTEKKVEGDA